MAETFDADWLALREPFDGVSRSFELAARLDDVLPARPRILDIGAGTGSLFRWLAPIIDRAQAWILFDTDARLLEDAFAETADWAEDMGYATSWPGIGSRRALLVHTPGGAWRMEARVIDLSDVPEVLSSVGADAVVCSALLDLVSVRWLQRFADALRTPFLACLSVDGHDAFLPAHPFDRTVLRAFRRDQGRDKGLGPAIGPRAPQVLHAMLAARGFEVATSPSDWRIPATAAAMLDDIVTEHGRVATRHLPAYRAAIDRWYADRLRQIDRRRLAIRIGHRDSLALPVQE